MGGARSYASEKPTKFRSVASVIERVAQRIPEGEADQHGDYNICRDAH